MNGAVQYISAWDIFWNIWTTSKPSRDLSIAWYSFSNVCGGLAARSLQNICACEPRPRDRKTLQTLFSLKAYTNARQNTHRRYNRSCCGRPPSIRFVDELHVDVDVRSRDLKRRLEHYLTKSGIVTAAENRRMNISINVPFICAMKTYM